MHHKTSRKARFVRYMVKHYLRTTILNVRCQSWYYSRTWPFAAGLFAGLLLMAWSTGVAR